MQTNNPEVSAVDSSPTCARLGCGSTKNLHPEGPEYRERAAAVGACPGFLSAEEARAMPWTARLAMPPEGSDKRAAASVLTSYGYPLGDYEVRRQKYRDGEDVWNVHNPFRFLAPMERPRRNAYNSLETWLEAHAGVLSKSTGQTGGAALLADWEESFTLAAAMLAESEARLERERVAKERATFKATLWERWVGVLPEKMVMEFVPPEDVPTWAPSTVYRPCQRITHAGREFICWTGGTSGTSPTWEKTEAASGDCQDGTVTWRRLSALEVARQWVQQFGKPLAKRDSPLLVFLGRVGGGKTTAGVVAIMEHALATWRPARTRTGRDMFARDENEPLTPGDVVFWSAPEVARRGLYGREVNDSIQEACNAEVLVIDDVASEFSTTTGGAGADAGNGPWLSMLNEVINRRYEACRLTLLSSNSDTDTFTERYGERIVDRIREAGRVVSVGTASMRRKRPADAVPLPVLTRAKMGRDNDTADRPRVDPPGFVTM